MCFFSVLADELFGWLFGISMSNGLREETKKKKQQDEGKEIK